MKTEQKQEAVKQEPIKQEAIKTGDVVALQYTGTLSDGSVFDTSEGRAPLQFEVGAGEVIPGFEKAVVGMKQDDERTFTIKSEEAYGPIRAELTQEVPKDKLPKEMKPELGMQLLLQGPQGERVPVTIAKVNENTVTIDMNHPLAGKDLTFKIKIVGVNDEELMKANESMSGGCCGGGGCGSGEKASSSGEGGCGSGGCGSGSCGEGGCGSGSCGSNDCSDEEEGIDHTQ